MRSVKRWGVILLAAVLLFPFSGCAKRYHVDYGTSKGSFSGARDSYPAGAKVELVFDLIATDTDYTFHVDGETVSADYEEGRGYVIRFVMPDHDITVDYASRNSMTYEPEPDPAEQWEEGQLLVSYYEAEYTAEEKKNYTEWALYASDSPEWVTLSVFVNDGSGEVRTDYRVPVDAVLDCYGVITFYEMETWKDQKDLISQDGAIQVCRFTAKDGTFYRVSTEAMPENGTKAFSRMKDAVTEFELEEYRITE